MKLSVASAELLAQLQSVARVASTRSAVQALSGVQLAATSAGVELRATDMEMSLRVPLPAEVPDVEPLEEPPAFVESSATPAGHGTSPICGCVVHARSVKCASSARAAASAVMS